MSAVILALTDVATRVVAADPVPDKNDVKAGWGAFGVFLLLAVAVGLLAWSFVRQLKKTQRNAEHGVFGPVDEESRDEDGPAA